jgi:hypothetical protein
MYYFQNRVGRLGVKSISKPKLWVYLTHFQSATHTKEYKVRFGYLATSVFYLSQIEDYELKIKVITNSAIEEIENLSASIESRLDGSTLEQYVSSESEITFRGRKFDWLLTWVHKSLFQKDLNHTKSDSGDLFLVLEDDALFTQANLEYFLDELTDLEEVGLLPTFIRSEWSDADFCWTHEDPIGRINETAIFFPHPKDDDKKLMQLQNPFSASILLNYPLAVEYFESESAVQALACYKHPVIYDIGSSACLGLIMENIPNGYLNRVAVICNVANDFPIPGSVVRHLGDRYAKDKWHRNIRLYDQVGSRELPTRRTSIDYIRRLFRKDVIFVLKKYFFSKHP